MDLVVLIQEDEEFRKTNKMRNLGKLVKENLSTFLDLKKSMQDMLD